MNKFTKIMLVSFFVFVSFIAIAVKAEAVTTQGNGTNQSSGSANQENMQNQRVEAQAKIQSEQARIQAEKEKLKAKNLAEAKKKAIKEIDNAIRKLTKIKERVSGMPNISADLKTQLNTKLDEWIAKFNDRKNAVNSAAAKDELKTAMEGFKAEVKEAKRVIKDIVEAIHKTHLQKVIAKIETFIPKVEAKAAAMTDASKKSEAADLVNDARSQITNAKSLVDAGKIEEARKAIKTAYRDLKNALEIVNGKGV